VRLRQITIARFVRISLDDTVVMAPNLMRSRVRYFVIGVQFSTSVAANPRGVEPQCSVPPVTNGNRKNVVFIEREAP
jgi:hypothetical protein